MRNLHDDTGFGSRHTTEAYLGYLQMTYLVLQLPAWSRNLTSKATLWVPKIVSWLVRRHFGTR